MNLLTGLLGLGGGHGLGAITPGLNKTWWGGVQANKVGCFPPRSYDTAPGRYVQLTGNVESALHVAFPKPYFDWQKEQLRSLTSAKPIEGTDPAQKVFYALDLWARIQYCLFSLNIPLGPYQIRSGSRPMSLNGGYHWAGGVGVPDNPVLVSMQGVVDSFYDSARIAMTNNKAALRYTPMSRFIREDMEAAPMRLAPFMTVVPWWYGTIGRSPQYSNNMRFVVEEKCIPWMVGGDRLPSGDASDSAFMTANSGNAGMLRAGRQWRLWSMRDHFPWGTYKSKLDDHDLEDRYDYDRWYRYMGTPKKMATLSQYISRVASEPYDAVVAPGNNGWFPTLQYVISYGLSRMAGVIMGLDYETVIQQHVEAWAQASSPPIHANGSMKTYNAGSHYGEQPMQLPMTCEDYKDATEDRQEDMKDRAQAEIGKDNRCECTEPPGDCDEGWVQKGAESLCEGTEQVMSAMEKAFPLVKVITTAFDFLLIGLMEVLPMAEGVYPIPYRVMHHPFTRNIKSPAALDTAAIGSTQTVLTHIGQALEMIQDLTGLQLEPWSKGPPPPPGKTDCDEFELDSAGVRRCVSTVTGDCYELAENIDGFYCLSNWTVAEWNRDPTLECNAKVIELFKTYRFQSNANVATNAMELCAREFRQEVGEGATASYIAAQKQAQEARMRMPIIIPPTAGARIPWGLIGLAAVGAILVTRKK